MDSIKAANRKKFQQSQKFNKSKNNKYKQKHNLFKNDKDDEEKEHSGSESQSSDNDANEKKDENISINEESDFDDDNTRFISKKKKANNNEARFDKVFEEDTEEYKQQLKLMKSFLDEEHERQINIQKEFIENSYGKANDSDTPRTKEELLNMTTEEMNNLLIAKKEPLKDTFVFNKAYGKGPFSNNSDEKVVNNAPKEPKSKSVIDSRILKIPKIPIQLSEKGESKTGAKNGKSQLLLDNEDFLDSVL